MCVGPAQKGGPAHIGGGVGGEGGWDWTTTQTKLLLAHVVHSSQQVSCLSLLARGF